MATLGVRDFFKLWTAGDPVSLTLCNRMLLDGLDVAVQAQPDVLGRIKKGKAADKPMIEWAEMPGYPTAIVGTLSTSTLTLTGTLFNKTATVELANLVLRVGTVLQRETDGMKCIVTVAPSGSPTVTVTVSAHGNCSLTDNGTDATYRIISELWSDYRDIDTPRGLERIPRVCGTQIFSETFEIPKTRENTTMAVVGDEVQLQITELINKMRRQLGYAIHRAEPVYSGGSYKFGNNVETPMMMGLRTWASVVQTEAAATSIYVDGGADEPTYDQFDDLARNMWLDMYSDFNSGDWALIGHPNVIKYINGWDESYRRMVQDASTVGWHVDKVLSKSLGKTFPVIADQYMEPGLMQLVNFADMSYGYYKNDEMNREEKATKGRYRQWQISFQVYGLVVRKPRQSIGTIYNLIRT